MPQFHSPNVPTIRTTGSPYLGGNVAVNGSDWFSGMGEVASRIGNNLFSSQREQRESDARLGLIQAQTDSETAQAKDRRDITQSRIEGRMNIQELFNQVGPAPSPDDPPEARQQWGFTANQASQAVIEGIANGTLDASEATATLAMLFNPAGGGPAGMTEEDRRAGNYGVDLSDGSVNENNVFSPQQGQERFDTSEANDIRGNQISAGATIRSAEIGAESRERIADRRIATGGGGGGGGNRVQNQGRSLAAAQRTFITAAGLPSETAIRGMPERQQAAARQRVAEAIRQNQVAIGRLADAYNSPTYNATAFSQFAQALARDPNAPTPAVFGEHGQAPAAAPPPSPGAASGGGGRPPPAAPARPRAGPPVGFDEDNNLVDSYGNVVLSAAEVAARRGQR